MKKILFILLIQFWFASNTNPENAPITRLEMDYVKNGIHILAAQLEKFNHLYMISLEQKLTTSTLKLGVIESNINHLQQRARVWDNFDQHLTAWNEQMAIMDRKMDIISKGQETILANLDAKIGSISQLQYQMDKIESRNSSNSSENTNNDLKSIVKEIDKKIELLPKTLKHNSNRAKLILKCDTSRIMEKMREVSNKVDAVFDKIKDEERAANEYDIQEFLEAEGSGPPEEEIPITQNIDQQFMKKILKKASQSCKEFSSPIEEILSRSKRNENLLRVILDRENVNNELITKLIASERNKNGIEGEIRNFTLGFNSTLQKYFNEQKLFCEENNIGKSAQIAEILVKPKKGELAINIAGVTTVQIQHEPDKMGCEDLEKNQTEGIFMFGKSYFTNENDRTINKRYCIDRNSTKWTVIQRHDDYSLQENFNRSWRDYKLGFGHLGEDFWFGNDFLSEITGNNQFLRIELEDFQGNMRWAEYSIFKIDPESKNYTLTIGGHSGNLSDVFGSYNGTSFRTYDKNNDGSSAGLGFWSINEKCPKVNLNGVYKSTTGGNLTDENDCQGIVWFPWMPDSSLKKSVMLIRRVNQQEKRSSENGLLIINKSHEDINDEESVGLVSVEDNATDTSYINYEEAYYN